MILSSCQVKISRSQSGKCTDTNVEPERYNYKIINQLLGARFNLMGPYTFSDEARCGLWKHIVEEVIMVLSVMIILN